MSNGALNLSGSPPYRVLICGSNYGQAYLEPLTEAAERFSPVALLARGSARSRRLAEQCRVPLFRSVDEVPAEIDIACAALPSSAEDVVLALLDRGIHVLCEHPRRSGFVAAAYRSASVAGVRFQINGHFGDLPAPRVFVERCRQLRAGTPPKFVDVMVQERGLYASLDILRQAVGELGSPSLGQARRMGHFVAVDAGLRDVRALIQVQAPPRRPADGSPRYLVDLRIVAGFAEGILSLLSLAGPVVWNANLSRLGEGADPLWEVVSSRRPATAAGLQKARAAANRAAVERLAREVESGEADPQVTFEHTLEVARWWEEIGAELRLDAP